MDPGLCDPQGFLVDDTFAFHFGLRLELKCEMKADNGVWSIPTSTRLSKTKLLCVVPEWVAAHIHAGDTFVIHNFNRTVEDGILTLTSKVGSLLPIKKLGDVSSTTAMEAYAGIAGWSHGAKLCGLETTFAIELDKTTADACGKSLNWPVLDATTAFDMHKNNMLPRQYVLQANANSLEALYFIGLAGTAVWLISPPCQPWSKAGSMLGLQSEGGQAFVGTVLNAAMMGASLVLAENVPGFPAHKDFKEVLGHISKAGWKCVISSQDGLLPVLPIFRTRWLEFLLRTLWFSIPK